MIWTETAATILGKEQSPGRRTRRTQRGRARGSSASATGHTRGRSSGGLSIKLRTGKLVPPAGRGWAGGCRFCFRTPKRLRARAGAGIPAGCPGHLWSQHWGRRLGMPKGCTARWVKRQKLPLQVISVLPERPRSEMDMGLTSIPDPLLYHTKNGDTPLLG